MKLRRQRNPESPEALAALIPKRRFTREEVSTFLELARGLVSNGLLVIGWSTIEETDNYYHVGVDFDNDTYEDWYFYKQYPDGSQGEQK